ncbi:site-specific integrase [Mucilaginibacter galii]|nr:site-specific integrase [Mucilaginibacter galii]
MIVNKLHILLFLYRSKANRKDTMPIYCRMTLNGQRKQFSSGCSLNEPNWDERKSLHKGLSTEAKHINNQLRSIRNRILKSYDFLARKGDHFDINQLYDQYSGKTVEIKTLLGVFDQHITHIKELIGIDYSMATYNKFVLIRSHVGEFIKSYYHLTDYPLGQLKLGFLQDFDHFLKLQKVQNQNTVNKTIERGKKVVKIAVAHGWLTHDPFALFRKKRFVKAVVYLDSEELDLLKNYQFSGKLNTIRNIFLFSCYTGLAYHEVSHLRNVHLKTNKGMLWIEMIRQKTKRPISVPLLPKALAVLEYYDYLNNDGALLPVISNQKLNAYLKDVGSELGIEKHLTHHVARKTFASTVLLNNDVPVDVASFLLGHSKVSTTEEFYAKVQRVRVLTHLSKISG